MVFPEGYQGDDSRCEVPLRIPLDPESRINRKVAKKVLDKERLEKMKEAR